LGDAARAPEQAQIFSRLRAISAGGKGRSAENGSHSVQLQEEVDMLVPRAGSVFAAIALAVSAVATAQAAGDMGKDVFINKAQIK